MGSQLYKKAEPFIKKAILKYSVADLDDIIHDPERQLDSYIIGELAKCEWIDRGKNLLITGQTGSGKSYLANALCNSTFRQFKSVRYIRASHLINELERASAAGSYPECLAQMAEYDLLTINDFESMELNMVNAP